MSQNGAQNISFEKIKKCVNVQDDNFVFWINCRIQESDTFEHENTRLDVNNNYIVKIYKDNNKCCSLNIPSQIVYNNNNKDDKNIKILNINNTSSDVNDNITINNIS